jgi:hypothetical protein
VEVQVTTALSRETREFLARCHRADDPPSHREKAVRDRLIAELGAGVVLGVAASAALGAAETMSAGATAASSASATSALSTASAGAATSTLAKSVAGAALVLGLGLGGAAAKDEANVARMSEGTVEVVVGVERAVKWVWKQLRHPDDNRVAAASPSRPDAPFAADPRRHRLLIEIARRPDHPVAIEAELVLILRAEEAIDARQPVLAMQKLDEHASRFPNGALRDRRVELRRSIERSASREIR